jgi:uncharacterized protein YegP (UPF0339 family)
MKYEIRLSKSDEYYFVIKARNGEIIATSEMYKTKQSCKKGIASVKRTWLAKVVDLT